MRYIRTGILVLFFSLSCTHLYAQFLNIDTVPPEADLSTYSDDFLAPNERIPGEAMDIFNSAPSGIYVSVGTERGFIGTALTPNATHLLLIDNNLKVVRFNQINIGLLQMANSRQDYEYLRHRASFDEWKKRAEQSDLLKSKEIFLDKKSWMFWKRTVGNNHVFDYFPREEVDDRSKIFWDSTYIFNDAKYQKISEMAKQGHMDAQYVDLRDSSSVQTIVDAIKTNGLAISVLDISNVHQSHHVSDEGNLAQSMETFKNVANPNSILLLTELKIPLESKGFPKGWDQYRWGYIDYTFNYLTTREAIVNILIHLPSEESLKSIPPSPETSQKQSPVNSSVPALPKERPYYDVYDLEQFPATERERILRSVIEAPTMQEALDIASQTIDVFIADEAEARKYGEKYVLSKEKKQILDEKQPDWINYEPAFFFRCKEDKNFIILISPDKYAFAKYILAHELIHRILHHGMNRELPATAVQEKLFERLTTLAFELEEFIVFQIERNSFEQEGKRNLPNVEIFGKIDTLISELINENKLNPLEVNRIIENMITSYRSLLPSFLPSDQCPLDFGLQNGEEFLKTSSDAYFLRPSIRRFRKALINIRTVRKLPIKENISGVGQVFLAGEISNLYFSLTETPESIVEFNKNLIRNPIGFIAGYEGFVLTQGAAQKALGFQNGKALDISFLAPWPRVQAFMTSLKQEVPMAVAMTVMESLRKMMEKKELLDHLDSATLMEQELFYVEVNNAILQSLILYVNSTCDVLSDPDTYIEGLRNTGQFVAAGSVVHYGKMALRAGRLYCNGAKARAAVEAAAGAETAGAGFLAATGELAATFIIEEYLDRAVSGLMSWWQERGLRQKLEEARSNFRILYTEPFAGDVQLKVAYDQMQEALNAYESFLAKDIQIALLQGEFEVESIKRRYDSKIKTIQHKESNRTYGEYQVDAYSWGGGASFKRQGDLEEKYEKTKTGWMILRTPIFEGLGAGTSYGSSGSVSTPTQVQQMTENEFESYIQNKTQSEISNRDLAIQEALDRTSQRALEIAQRIYGRDSNESTGSPLLSLRKEQIKFLESL